ncbi:BACON domain-containing protein [Terriglobus sp. TAA 43]|uniref:BACON domain-containing protein n=1 Tax=Terriglobus sp. TAA 43 TaxID=278961 RepID=UPI000648D08E|nr:BACON domain-containing carbohydrate-binding protein [Terriglobus sp. TAA 43]
MNLHRSLRNLYLVLLSSLLLTGIFLLPPSALAQSQDLTVVVLVNSSNTTGYNTNTTTPGTYQMGPERYLVHLQVPYKVVDVSTTAAIDLSASQLIIAGHNGLNPSVAWQNAIVAAVANGTGFMNLDSDTGIGTQTHIQTLFHATGATLGQAQTSITIPAAVQVGGAQAHYIAALQRHWLNDDPGDITYNYHGNGVTTIASNATLLTGATGTVVAELGTDPLILTSTYGRGRIVDFTTYDYMHADRFGFVQGIDDLFWRSVVWAARKPFVLRGYPRIAAIQMDDNEVGVMSRIPDMWNTSLTGTVASDGTGGPWMPQLNLQVSSVATGDTDRAPMITAINANNLHASIHGLDYGSGGDMYWNLTVPTTDAQWQANVASALSWKAGSGGTDTFPKLSRSMVAHYWDISDNTGYEMYNSLNIRYITSPQAAGTYYFDYPKTVAGRTPLGPFRIYEQPPVYPVDYDETFPFFYADDVVVHSVAGKPAQTFFGFATQVGQMAGRFTRPDALWPSSTNGYTVAQSLNQWEYYMWHFWSGMEPVQIYTHDGNNLDQSTVADRQSFISQLSTWFKTNKGTHQFMDGMGDYLRARNHSLLKSGTVTPSTVSLTFTGAATDADGNLIATKSYIFYGDDEGTLLSVPGFSNGGTYTFTNQAPPTMQVSPESLSFSTSVGTSPASKTVTVTNLGSGTYTWTATSNASWLTTTPTSGSSGATVTVKVSSNSLAAGTYTGTITVSSTTAAYSPYTVTVTLTVIPTNASLVGSPASLAFTQQVGTTTASAAQTVSITNPSTTNVNWTATSSASWLTVTPASGGTPGTVSASVKAGSLTAGSYSGTITIKSTSPALTLLIPVTFTVTAAPVTISTSNLNSWTISPLGGLTNWSSTGSALKYNGAGVAPIYAGSAAWTDYDLSVNMTMPVSNYPGGFRARVNPVDGSGYALWFYPSDHTVNLYKVVNWNISNGYTLIGTYNSLVFDANAHTYLLSMKGSNLTVSRDGVQLFTATDSTYTSGLVALDPSNQVVSYNSVVVSNASSLAATLAASPTSLTFSAVPGATATAQSVNLTSTSSLSWTASTNAAWLTAAPVSGTATPATVSVTASAATLSAGTYTGTLTLTPSSGSPVQIPVTLTVSASPSAVINAVPSSLYLFSPVGSSPTAATVSVQNSGTGALPWTATSNVSWLTPSPSSSSAAGTLTLTPSTAALAVGTVMGNVTLSSTNATTPVTVPVTLNIGNLLFQDQFASGSSQWTASPLGMASNWSVSNGAFNYNGNGHTQQYAGSQTWTDYTVSADVKLTNTSNYPGGLRGRVNLTTGASYAVWLYPGDNTIKLLRSTAWAIDSDGLALVGQSPTMLLDTNKHTIRLQFVGNQIRVYYDNTLIISATDGTLTSGGIALDVSSQPISFSNVVVQQ